MVNVRVMRIAWGGRRQLPKSVHVVVACMLLGAIMRDVHAEPEVVIPHHQSVPPGPALSPEEAIAKMDVPPGFSVELVASEPDLMNPVAMTIDEQGRFWVTESFEYPRRSAGPGRDRIKVLEDTDHDGRVDKVTVFAEGLNIPSGIAVGHGGVWVANSPDILFLQDTDGDLKADRQQVVVSGFGRTDTHELPNSLTWGPDGWLYGLNGVFNHSHVKHRGKDYEFTCALFRIHPRTWDFELFCEGTSNPWGVTFDTEGSAFISACVIDHLWHLTETGYYHRQGGPYPPFTWKLESIVDHKHQMAAYCGITYFDSAAYPEAYRERLYMGNIHGGCINVDFLERRDSTYFAKPAPDFLTANDAWFMPVVQKTGPDGCLYILDWYDRYHCYQDANRDPEGIDRGRGRLYRVRYQETPRAEPFNLAAESDDTLIDRLRSDNIFFRDLAQRLLVERHSPELSAKLQRVVLSKDEHRKTQLHALWALVGGGSLSESFHLQLLKHADPTFRAWAVRAAGNQKDVSEPVLSALADMVHDSSGDVRLQVAIAANKLAGAEAVAWLLAVLQHPASDLLIPHIVWQNLLPHFEHDLQGTAAQFATIKTPTPGANRVLPHVVRRLLAEPEAAGMLGDLLSRVLTKEEWSDPSAAMEPLISTLKTQEAWRDKTPELHAALSASLAQEVNNEAPTMVAAVRLGVLLGVDQAKQTARAWLDDDQQDVRRRIDALDVLVADGDADWIPVALRLLQGADSGVADEVIQILGRLNQPQVAEALLASWNRVPDNARPRVLELLTQRPTWTKQLLAAIEAGSLPRDALHINQLRRLQASQDRAIREQVKTIWGSIREGRNPEVEASIAAVDQLLRERPGSVERGRAVFAKTCAQCHQMHGQGEQVGPDITRNGRASYAQLLSNVFDPNLVIGDGYQARNLITEDGRTLSGLLVEENETRVVLKLQGGKEEVIARDEIDTISVSPLSLMPEGWEKQLPPQELVDLLHFLTLEGDPAATATRRIPGTPELKADPASTP